MTCFFIEIRKKEGFVRLDGAYELTGRTRVEWKGFPSHSEAHDACRNALADEKVISASVVTPEFYLRDDYCVS